MYIEDLKFSLWADFIERGYLDKEFKELINNKIINGATSNPAIFKNAILTSPAYKTQLESLAELCAKEKYEEVAIYDIQKAADILKPLYDKGDDGYVSIEVDPFLCDDTQATVEEGKRLFQAINRQNVMIKVPATKAGYGAMKELTAVGIPINATLVFKKSQAIYCAEAFQEGIEIYGKSVDTVISIFVSRIDRALDKVLEAHGIPTALTGIYNTSVIYEEIQSMNVSGCRALFASTGVKDDSLPPYYYVEKLLAYNSVNTAPIDTIKAFHAHGSHEKALPIDKNIINEHFTHIEDIGINVDEVLQKQIDDGLEAFKEAFKEILEAL
jgi:transaldolase